MRPIKLAYAPTRRSIFSAPDAVKYRNLTAQRLRELGVDFVDIDDINEEGLLYSEEDRLKMLAKFRAAGVDGLLLAHCNFGTEYLCARLAKDLGVPVLLWGPLDERPEPDGTRLRGHPVRPVCHRQGAAAVRRTLYLPDQLPPHRPGLCPGNPGFSGGVQRGAYL